MVGRERLVNGAGIIEGGAIVDIPGDNLRRQFEVNVVGPVLLTQGIARKMIARRSGRIVFMSSVVGIVSGPFVGAYGASKHALEAIAETMAMESQEFGVEVAVISPSSPGSTTPRCWRRRAGMTIRPPVYSTMTSWLSRSSSSIPRSRSKAWLR